ncbi:MAG: PilZ domain-containing protein, partial [Candidatus Omnitrophica bacterium]|nr:PilZ domain-containing protein [Candidatus Omnitrophota bacterium]
MENKRRLIRIEVEDFLEIQPLNEVAKMFEGKAKDLSLVGVCFSSQAQWQKGQVLLIDYFLHNELDSVKLKVAVVWSEFI